MGREVCVGLMDRSDAVTWRRQDGASWISSAKGTFLLSPGQRPGTRVDHRCIKGPRVLKGRPSTPDIVGRGEGEASRLALSAGLWNEPCVVAVTDTQGFTLG